MKVFPSPLGDLYLGKINDGLHPVIQALTPQGVFIVADENTARECLPKLKALIQSEKLIVIAPGDRHKTIESCEQIWTALAEAGADRSSLVLNVGGGMICDLGGFAAACYQRGIRFGHIPTSLLAMADAAIGGKTGVNFKGYKNYIGRFEPPAFVWIDPVFLETLPRQEILDGLAEIIKHAVIGSRPLWETISAFEDISSINWMHIIDLNTPVKQDITASDPLEKGMRKALNFGHTIGHALESHFLPSTHPLSHGQAVTLGMMAEAKLARITGHLGNEDFQAIIDLIERLLSPSEVTLPSFNELQPWLLGDKKKSKGMTRYSLPDKIGSCGWDIIVEDHQVAESLDWLNTQVKA
jgi:3-dehydroquinate synthase